MKAERLLAEIIYGAVVESHMAPFVPVKDGYTKYLKLAEEAVDSLMEAIEDEVFAALSMGVRDD